MVAEWVTLGILAIGLAAEFRHAFRIRRVAHLAFGPERRPRVWTMLAPVARVVSLAAMAWGFLSLWWVVEPQVHNQSKIDESDYKHLLLVVDVSPSMNLGDAGPGLDESRRARAAAVLESLFNRVPMREYKISMIGVYSEAKPLLKESTDIEVVRHIVENMPLWHGFKPGKTDLIAGLNEAAKMATGWDPRSATVVVLTDGDSVPATGMPSMPASVANVFVVGVGDAVAGKYIDGHQSRQDVATLRQLANRLNGIYHNGNQKHLTSQIIGRMTETGKEEDSKKWTRREWSLAAIAAGAVTYSALPLLLVYFGSRFRAGVSHRRLIAAAGS